MNSGKGIGEELTIGRRSPLLPAGKTILLFRTEWLFAGLRWGLVGRGELIIEEHFGWDIRSTRLGYERGNGLMP